MAGQVPRRSGADEEADPESDPDHRECPRAVLRRGHVGDVRLRDGEIAGGETVDDARQEDEEEVGRVSEHEKARERADLAGGQDRLAPEMIGELPEHRAGDELADRVRAHEQADHRGTRAEVLRVEGEQRQHDGETEDVHHHDEEDGEERRPHPSAASLVQASSSTSSFLAKQNRSSFSPSPPR